MAIEMTNDAWFRFWTSDWDSGTRRMHNDEVGAYLRLILDYYKSGPLPDDPILLPQIACCQPKDWARVWGVVGAKFVLLDGKYHNQKCDDEIRWRNSQYVKKLRQTDAALRARGITPKHVTSDVTSHVTSDVTYQCNIQQNQNQNQNQNKSKSQSKNQKQHQGAEAPVAFPKELDTQDFKAVWEDWTRHRQEIRKPLKPTGTKEQLAKLAGWGKARAVKALRHSMANGWAGIFEERTKGDYTKPQATSCL